jgi:hypothetical protein
MIRELDRFWGVFAKAKLPSSDPTLRHYGLHLGGILQPEFVQHFVLCCKALLRVAPAFEPAQAQGVARADWAQVMSSEVGAQSNVGVDAMNRHLYLDFMFELADFWCVRERGERWCCECTSICLCCLQVPTRRTRSLSAIPARALLLRHIHR